MGGERDRWYQHNGAKKWKINFNFKIILMGVEKTSILRYHNVKNKKQLSIEKTVIETKVFTSILGH